MHLAIDTFTEASESNNSGISLPERRGIFIGGPPCALTPLRQAASTLGVYRLTRWLAGVPSQSTRKPSIADRGIVVTITTQPQRMHQLGPPSLVFS